MLNIIFPKLIKEALFFFDEPYNIFNTFISFLYCLMVQTNA